jgi:DNA gyrase subunit A
MVAHKKKAAKFDAAQGMLDLLAAGARDADEEDVIDVGGEELMDENLIDDED